MEKKTMGSFLAALRRASGMTQKELAERLNVSDKSVSRWERDDGAPDLALIPVIAEVFGAEKALIKEAPSMGAEDFSYFLDHAPGAFFHIGCSADAAHPCAPLHSAEFDPDENCIPVGVAMEAALATGE